MSVEPLTLLAELEEVAGDLAQLHAEEATSYIAWRKSYLSTYTRLMSEQGKSATEARVWAEAAAITVQAAHVTLKADIAALVERRTFLLSAIEAMS